MDMTPITLCALTVGDAVAGALPGRAAPVFVAERLTDPGPRRWHALLVMPQSEARVEMWLARHGVYGFHPVLMVRRRQGVRVVAHARRYLPGYVFARFDGPARPHAILAHPDVRGAICRADGSWGVLAAQDLRAIHAMRDQDRSRVLAAHAARKKRMAAVSLCAGAPALFRAGPLAGQVAEVIELRPDGGAVVRLRLFGAEIDAQARTQDLVGLQSGLDS
jgi:transcription antitermination factor NusG